MQKWFQKEGFSKIVANEDEVIILDLAKSWKLQFMKVWTWFLFNNFLSDSLSLFKAGYYFTESSLKVNDAKFLKCVWPIKGLNILRCKQPVYSSE